MRLWQPPYRIETVITVTYDNLFKCPDELGAVVLFHVLGHIQYIVCSFLCVEVA